MMALSGHGITAVSASVRVARNTPEAIESGVRTMLDEVLGAGDGAAISCMIASSPDLDAAFPAAAARRWGLACPVMGLTSAHAGPCLLELLAHVNRSDVDA